MGTPGKWDNEFGWRWTLIDVPDSARGPSIHIRLRPCELSQEAALGGRALCSAGSSRGGSSSRRHDGHAQIWRRHLPPEHGSREWGLKSTVQSATSCSRTAVQWMCHWLVSLRSPNAGKVEPPYCLGPPPVGSTEVAIEVRSSTSTIHHNDPLCHTAKSARFL